MNSLSIYSTINEEFETNVPLEDDDIDVKFDVVLELIPVSRDPSSELDWEMKDITWQRDLYDDKTNILIQEYLNKDGELTRIAEKICKRMMEF